jgi:hypothetical protein
MPPDLFSRPPFSIVPEAGRTEPRLWVRRLVIWSDPDTLVRDIQLKRGLNIVWSPDPRTKDVAMGHGGGKTTLCRLLRYCLGEDSFASDTQRQRIANKLPKGCVGAEIMIEGNIWSVVRSLGFRKRDIVIENATVEEALRGTPTGIEPLRKVTTSLVLGDAATLMPSDVGEIHAWEAALAWATRDQECRFGDHLRWRDPNTDSHSPVRQLGTGELLVVVRALIGAITKSEITTQEVLEDDTKKANLRSQEIERLKWQLAKTRSVLVQKLGLPEEANPDSPMEVEAFKATANEKLARALQVPAPRTTTDLSVARRERDAALEEWRRFESELKTTDAVLTVKNRLLTMMRGEDKDLGNQLVTAKNPICPICEVPIDKVLAEGCGISKTSCDLQRVKERLARLRDEIAAEQESIEQLRRAAVNLKRNIAQAKSGLNSFELAVRALERNEREHSQAVSEARNAVYDAERYQAMVSDLESCEKSMNKISEGLEETKSRLAANRASASETIRHLSLLFSDVLRELVPGEISGELKLDGKGLTLKVELGGERSTAAIDSLKVVAFDLAVLAMSIEGHTRMPSFLLHDSPREADLGLSIYHQLFEFARNLQRYGPVPLFQYIVTTTTEPPKEFLTPEWLRLTIRGAPASERLLLVDL